MKKCPKCRHPFDGLRYCLPCSREYAATYRAKNRSKINEYNKQYLAKNREKLKLKRNDLYNNKYKLLTYWPNLTIDEAREAYRSIFVSQEGKCKICSLPKKLFIDHDHSSGIVRGLLCDTCNRAIGFFKDNPTLCIQAASYLKRKVK